jgi:TP901 family phage tail tape measure protein
MAAKEFPLAVVIRGVDRVTGVMGKVQGAIDKVGAVAERATSKFRGLGARMGLPQLQASLRGLGERSGLPVLRAAADKTGAAVVRLGRTVAWAGAGFAALAAGVSAAAWKMVRGVVDVGGHLADLQGQLGVNIERFQEWTYAAKLNGVEQEQLAQGIRVLNKSIGETAAGTGEAKDVFKALGINVRDAKGHIKNAEQILPAIADKLQKIHSPALRAAIAQKLLGKAGQQLIPMLQDGSKGLAEAGKEAHALGLVLSQDTVNAADRAGDTFDKLGAAARGIGATVGAALLPVMQNLADRLIVLAEKYGPAISAWAERFAEQLPHRLEQLKELFKDLWGKIQPLVKGIAWMTDTFGTANVILGAVAAVIAASVLPAMVALTSAIYTIGVAIATTPIGWILGLLALLAAAAMLIYRNWEPISRWLGDHLFAPFFDALGAVGKFFSKTWNAITGTFHRVLKAMGDAWDKYNPVALIRAGIESLMGWLSNWNLGQVIRDKIAAIASYLPAWMQKKLGIADLAAAAQSANAAGAAPVGAAAVGQGTAAAQNGQVRVKVDFDNLPKGSKVSTEQKGAADFELNQGYAMQGAW